jgi:hypothetical protein
MLTSASNLEGLIEAREVRFLANQDKNLHFGLLTDFRDADTEVITRGASGDLVVDMQDNQTESRMSRDA